MNCPEHVAEKELFYITKNFALGKVMRLFVHELANQIMVVSGEVDVLEITLEMQKEIDIKMFISRMKDTLSKSGSSLDNMRHVYKLSKDEIHDFIDLKTIVQSVWKIILSLNVSKEVTFKTNFAANEDISKVFSLIYIPLFLCLSALMYALSESDIKKKEIFLTTNKSNDEIEISIISTKLEKEIYEQHFADDSTDFLLTQFGSMYLNSITVTNTKVFETKILLSLNNTQEDNYTK